MTAITALPRDLRYSVDDRAVGEDASRIRSSLGAASPCGTSIALGDIEEKLALTLAVAAETDTRVAESTVCCARSFLHALPLAHQRSVDVQTEPGGEILCEWGEASSRRIVTLAINEQGRIAYSGIYGSSRFRGQEHFDGSLPEVVALAIGRMRQS